MIKNFAICSFVILMMVVFSNYIKEWSFDARVAVMMARIDVEDDEAKSRLREVLGRVGDGYGQRSYNHVETIALIDLVKEVKSYQGKEMPEKTAESLSNRFEVIVERYGL